MQVYIPASSPLLEYKPTRASWTPGYNATGMYAFSNQSVAFNFTGHSLTFGLEFASVNASRAGSSPGGSSEAGLFWSTRLMLNGTEAGRDSTSLSADNLPAGRHLVELQIFRLDGNTTRDSYAYLQGVRGTLNAAPGPGAWNLTLDDSVRNASVVMEGNWSRLSINSAVNNTIANATTAALEVPRLNDSYAGTLSVADTPGSAVQLSFSGDAVWVYGPSGGDFGSYNVKLDGADAGTHGPTGGNATYGQLLYHTSGLAAGEHSLRLSSTTGRIGFDRLVAAHGLVASVQKAYGTLAVPTTTVGYTPPGFKPIPVTPTPSPAVNKGANTTAVAASVGTIGGIMLATLLGFFIWACCRRRKRRQRQAHQSNNYPFAASAGGAAAGGRAYDQSPRWNFRKSRGWRMEETREWNNNSPYAQMDPRLESRSNFGSLSSHGHADPRPSVSQSHFHPPRPSQSNPNLGRPSMSQSRPSISQPRPSQSNPNFGSQPRQPPRAKRKSLFGRQSTDERDGVQMSALNSLRWKKEPHYNKASEISSPLPEGHEWDVSTGMARPRPSGESGEVRNWYDWFGGVYAGQGQGQSGMGGMGGGGMGGAQGGPIADRYVRRGDHVGVAT